MQPFSELKRKAEAGDRQAQFNLGLFYCRGGEGKIAAQEDAESTKKREKAAFEWLYKAAEQGHQVAPYYLGWMYNVAEVEDDVIEREFKKIKNDFYRKCEEVIDKGELDNKTQRYNKIQRFIMAFWYFLQSAERGYAKAQFVVGYMYYDGVPYEDRKTYLFINDKSYYEAFEWTKRSALQGYAKAQNGLGIMYLYGIGVECNEEEAFEWFKKAAEQAFPEAQYQVALMYEEGIGVEKDSGNAMYWADKGGKQMDAEALYNLGWRHYKKVCELSKDEKSQKSDREEAFKWAFYFFKKSAQRNYAPAQYKVGNMYIKGEGVAKDFTEGFKWLNKAAEQGYPPAQCMVGNMYIKGEGVAKDFNEGIKWLNRAAEQGYPPAKYDLGFWYEKYQAKGQAFDLYREAAEQGYPPAQNRLGEIYYEANKDYEAAFKWLERAAKQGHKKACEKLAIMYKEGKGVAQDLDKAAEYAKKSEDTQPTAEEKRRSAVRTNKIEQDRNKGDFEKYGSWIPDEIAFRKMLESAEQGNLRALWSIGCAYREGKGVKKDLTKAKECFEKAAEGGLVQAQCLLGLMYYNGDEAVKIEKNYAEAFKWLQQAGAEGDSQAEYHLGLMYFDGNGVKKDVKTAFEWIKKAAEKGNGNAIKWLQEKK